MCVVTRHGLIPLQVATLIPALWAIVPGDEGRQGVSVGSDPRERVLSALILSANPLANELVLLLLDPLEIPAEGNAVSSRHRLGDLELDLFLSLCDLLGALLSRVAGRANIESCRYTTIPRHSHSGVDPDRVVTYSGSMIRNEASSTSLRFLVILAAVGSGPRVLGEVLGPAGEPRCELPLVPVLESKAAERVTPLLPHVNSPPQPEPFS